MTEQSQVENSDEFDMDLTDLYSIDEAPTAQEPTESKEPEPTLAEPTVDNEGDEESEEEEISKEETPPTEHKFSVEVDGQQVEYLVSGDYTPEQLEKIKLQQMLHSDYTKKRQADAEKAKQIDAKASQLDQILGLLNSELEYSKDVMNSEEMIRLQEYDEDEYNRRVLQHQSKQQMFEKVKNARQQELEAKRSEEIERERNRLPELIPEWLDPKKQESDLKEMEQYLKDIGTPPEDFSFHGDKAYKLVQTRDAMNYRKLLKSLESKKDKSAPSSSKPTSSNKVEPEKSLYDYFADEMK